MEYKDEKGDQTKDPFKQKVRRLKTVADYLIESDSENVTLTKGSKNTKIDNDE